MSQPNMPNITPNISLTRDDVVNLLLASIALEEMGLSHIINAEGEKIQFALGTLPGQTGPGGTLQDILAVNQSVQSMMETLFKKEMILESKMKAATNIPTSQGSTGPTGPTGPPGFSSNGEFLLNIDALVQVNASIPFDNVDIVGLDIMYPENNGIIMLSGNQSYLVLYALQTALTTQPIAGALYLDTVEISDSKTVISSSTLVNQTIIRTGPGTHQLELRITQSTNNPASVEKDITSLQVIRIS
ncbi:collagen-like protein [Bacillus cereus]|uniref:collagen-like protein n=1 Tax=Bacillus cereus TaxID=1396 RepID=UPI0009C5F849|nr:collagen-like protein [Bacillus cereus]OPA14661.1 hypothetical protein BHL54_11665 [Bacillus cereus]